jgi:hypothetical protein
MTRKHILALAALLSLAAAVFQMAIGLVPDWSAYFDAPNQLLARPALLLGASIIVAVLFTVSAAYAASGAGYIRKLPLLRTALLVTGVVFLVRGWIFIPLLLASLDLIHSPVEIPGTALGSSAAFLLLAALYLAGAAANWRLLRPDSRQRAH